MRIYETVGVIFLWTFICEIKASTLNHTRVKRQDGKSDNFFRTDYFIVDSMEAFYKLHTYPRSWLEARARCQAEGAELVAPETSREMDVLKGIMLRLHRRYSDIYIGVHDMFSAGDFVSLAGIQLLMNDDWADGEPHDKDGTEHCVTLSRTGRLSAESCQPTLPFICKLPMRKLTANPICETADAGYIHSESVSRCYKFHVEAKNWSQAHGVCEAEGSYLAIINSEVEANVLVQLMQRYPAKDLPATYWKEPAMLGFHDHFQKGEYRTLFGQTLPDAGYNKWAENQPDNASPGENCGSMFRNGLLNDIWCNRLHAFICERELGDPNLIKLFSRSSKNKPKTTTQRLID